jgi:hypothetical protein
MNNIYTPIAECNEYVVFRDSSTNTFSLMEKNLDDLVPIKSIVGIKTFISFLTEEIEDIYAIFYIIQQLHAIY